MTEPNRYGKTIEGLYSQLLAAEAEADAAESEASVAKDWAAWFAAERDHEKEYSRLMVQVANANSLEGDRLEMLVQQLRGLVARKSGHVEPGTPGTFTEYSTDDLAWGVYRADKVNDFLDLLVRVLDGEA